VCSALKTSSSLPLVANYIQSLRELIPSVPTECPKKVPYRFEALKINYSDVGDDGSAWYGVPVANGIYRTVLKFYTKDDPKAFIIEWRVELKYNKNIDIFN
jgi:hypothetical protein